MQEGKQIWSVGSILDWSVNFFKLKEIPQPKLSSELLLAAVLKCSRMQLYLNFDHILKENERFPFPPLKQRDVDIDSLLNRKI